MQTYSSQNMGLYYTVRSSNIIIKKKLHLKSEQSNMSRMTNCNPSNGKTAHCKFLLSPQFLVFKNLSLPWSKEFCKRNSISNAMFKVVTRVRNNWAASFWHCCSFCRQGITWAQFLYHKRLQIFIRSLTLILLHLRHNKQQFNKQLTVHAVSKVSTFLPW